MKKFLIILMIGLCSFSGWAQQKRTAYQYSSNISYALWNIDTGDFISGNNQELVRPMASITKLMSVLVTFREGLDLDEELTVTGKETSTRIRAGMRIARSKLIELALVSSDNLATRTLAESFPGGYNRFIDQMNAVAHELGMNHTKYQDATGLLANNISNTDDIRKLVLAVSPLHFVTHAANTAKVAFRTVALGKNRQKEIVVYGTNTNSFVGKLDIIAAKTGYTSKAGRCLTMMFNHNGSTYLMVIMGANSGEQRKKIVETLLDKIK
jgi:D-alanyl-D-alanine endopeptidase (penicillin-binding protein 7)